MTLCIAAACRHKDKRAIVLCTDSRAEKGLAFSELRVGSDDADKVRGMWNFTALIAGHPTHADELLTQCDQAVKKFSSAVPDEDTDIVITSFFEDLRKAVRARKRQLVEHHIGMTTTFKDFDDFVNRSKQVLSESHYNKIWDEIKAFGLGAEVIISGFHGDEAIIVKLDDGGEVHWEDHYSVIGTGSQIALAFLCQNEYDDDIPLGECLYRVFEAKVAAHKNRTVGQLTYFEVSLTAAKITLRSVMRASRC